MVRPHYFYRITSPTGRVYIGKTVDPKRRVKDYKAKRCEKQRILFSSICKYGWNNHTFEILFERNCRPSTASKIEIKLIAKHGSFNTPNGMNITSGGEGFAGLPVRSGYSLSEETKRKLSIANKGRKLSEEQKELIRQNNAMRSEEHKQKMREACRKPEYREAARQRALGNYNGKRIRVRQLDVAGKPIAEFDSAMHAERAVEGTLGTKITACCKGKRRTHGGYRWEYA